MTLLYWVVLGVIAWALLMRLFSGLLKYSADIEEDDGDTANSHDG